MSALQRLYASLPRTYWTLWLGMFVNKLGGFVVPFLALVLSRRGLAQGQVGLVVSCWGVGAFLAGLVGGVLADRLGRRRTMLLSLVGGGLCMIGLGQVSHLALVAPLTFLTAFTGEMYRPAVSAAVADVVPVEERTRAYGYLYWVINLAFAIAPALGGLLSRAPHGDTWLFVGDGLTMLVYAAIVWWKVPETRPAVRPGTTRAGMSQVAGDRLFMGLLLLIFANALVMWQTGITLPLDMKSKGIDDQTFGLLIGINGMLIVFLQPQITRWTRGRDRGRVLALGACFFAAGMGLHGLVSTPMGYALAISLWTLGEIASFPLQSAMVADLAPPELRGRYQGAYGMAWGLASALGPTLGSQTAELAGAPWLWLGCAGLLVACALGHLGLAPGWRRRL